MVSWLGSDTLTAVAVHIKSLHTTAKKEEKKKKRNVHLHTYTYSVNLYYSLPLALLI